MLSPILPANFQYFGLFGLLVYTLQGAIAGLIVRKLTGNTLSAIIGCGFFIMATPMLLLMFIESALSVGIIILFCIYACITKENTRTISQNSIIWGGLFFLSVGIHLYFVPMVGIFMFFYFLDDYLKTKEIRPIIISGIISCVVLLVTMFLFGAFYSHADVTVGSFGGMSVTPKALLNPLGKSKFLRELSTLYPQQIIGSVGHAYIVLGIILGIIMILALFIKKYKCKSFQLLKKTITYKTKMTMALLFVFFWFASYPLIAINGHILLKYYIPGINIVFQIFRDNGRMIWPAMYIVICLVVCFIVKKHRGKIGITILAILLIIQYHDLSNFINIKGAPFKQRIEWKTELSSNVWNTLGKKYIHIVFMDSVVIFFNESNTIIPNLKLFSFHDLAIKNNLTINDTYLARKNGAQIDEYRKKEKQRILNNEADETTLYIFETQESAEPYTQYLHLYPINDIILGTKTQESVLATNF